MNKEKRATILKLIDFFHNHLETYIAYQIVARGAKLSANEVAVIRREAEEAWKTFEKFALEVVEKCS